MLRSSRALLLGSLPLVLLILALAATQYTRQRATLLSDLSRLADEQHFAVAGMLAEADKHVARMRETMAESVASQRDGPPRLEPAALRPTEAPLAAGTTVALELASFSPDDRLSGNLMAVPDFLSRPAETLRLAAASLDMLRVVRLEHRVGNASHWSYYFAPDASFITMFPGATLGELAQTNDRQKPLSGVGDMIGRWLRYDVYRHSTPQQNPGRLPYWTQAYEDSGGAGAMVSHGAPVYSGDRFAGMVATDILLSRFGAILDHAGPQAGILAVVNDRGQVLGAVAPEDGADQPAEERLRQAGAFAAEGAGDTPGFAESGNGWVYSKAFADTPFRLVHLVGEREMATMLLPRLAPYGLILAGLAVTLGFLLLLFHHAFVAPGFRLASFLRDHALGASPSPPKLSAAWRPHFQAVSDAFAVTRDIQRRLGESEARFHSAIASLADGFAILDRAGQVLFANESFRRHLEERDRDNLDAGRPLDKLRADGALPRAKQAQLADGRWMSVRTSPAGEAGGTVVILRDITEDKRAELGLRDSEARYRAVVDTQSEFVVRFGGDGRITFANEAYFRYMGMGMEELGSLPRGDFDFIHPDDQAANRAHIARLTPQNPTSTITLRAWMPDRSFRWEEWTDTGVFDASGRMVEMQSVGRDITEARATREALYQSEKLAALGSMLAGVAHELNNPLSIVVGYAGMLNELADDPATRRRAKEIHAAAERCARIVKTFLAMARSKPASRQPVDLDAVVEDVLELAAYGLRTAGLSIARTRMSGLPPVLADPDQIHQVVMNVVINAQHAMADVDGERRLTITTVREGNDVALSIADTGPGMDAETRKRAFEPFFTTKPQGMGTGIGLAVCLGIVESHGGTITLDGAPGLGTTAVVRLPAIRESDASAPLADQLGSAASKSAGRLGGRLLVVDDEPAIAAFVAEALGREGVDVVAATGADEARRMALEGEFDAVLTDLRMPGMSGSQLIALLRAERPALGRRVVAMTGDALGAVPPLGSLPPTILEKPLDLQALRAALEPFLSGLAGRAAA